MTHTIQVRHDGFACASLMRCKASDGECAWCGTIGRRWMYWWSSDSAFRREAPPTLRLTPPRYYCSISCYRIDQG